MNKPLGHKSYGSIGHLPNSRLGSGDHKVHEGQGKICTEKVRDKHDLIICTEKVDGSCCSVALINNEILALSRSGYLASTSPYKQHHLFTKWVRKHEARFRSVLKEGERLCGEWLIQAHSTRYNLPHEPFVVFDLMRGQERALYDELLNRVIPEFIVPKLLYIGNNPISVEAVLKLIEISGHGAIDPVEGAVWRVERKGKVDFLAKYVKLDKKDGIYLPEISGGEAIYNVNIQELLD